MLAYSKESQITAVLAVREFQRASLVNNLGSDWTEARIGMFFSGVDAHDENLAAGDELLTVADVSDYLTIGIKDRDTLALPGEADSMFLGVRSTGLTSKSTSSWMADSNQECSAIGYVGATIINAGVVANGPILYPDPAPTSGYSGFYCIKFVVNNRGLSSQSVLISVARSNQIAGLDYGKSALYQKINNATFGAFRTVAWNTGAAARDLPDAAFIRIPFYNSRIRIQQIMSVKITP